MRAGKLDPERIEHPKTSAFPDNEIFSQVTGDISVGQDVVYATQTWPQRMGAQEAPAQWLRDVGGRACREEPFGAGSVPVRNIPRRGNRAG